MQPGHADECGHQHDCDERQSEQIGRQNAGDIAGQTEIAPYRLCVSDLDHLTVTTHGKDRYLSTGKSSLGWRYPHRDHPGTRTTRTRSVASLRSPAVCRLGSIPPGKCGSDIRVKSPPVRLRGLVFGAMPVIPTPEALASHRRADHTTTSGTPIYQHITLRLGQNS